MKIHIIILLSLLSWGANAQQWVEKKYPYDSMLNVVYGTATNFNGSTETLLMDIYTPLCGNDTAARPLLLWIHGGAFLAGSKEDQSITRLCKLFAQRGYVTVSINYRLGFIADDAAWNCNYPNYSCVFATDTAEWYRVWYRAVQDGKGALRYLVNRHEDLGIDPNNVFVAGESAGAFVALGTAFLDAEVERPVQTFALSDAPQPAANALTCLYNQGEMFGNTVARPDLGGIGGTIEPSNVTFTIKGVGNMYGAMLSDLLKNSPANQPKPAIYSFHQPCDLVVPIDSGRVYTGLSWCFTNGYNCYGIANTPKVYGSRIISKWNSAGNYGYNIKDEFTTVNFPFSFLLGPGSCLDQVNTPCHAYDNFTLRETNLAQFFAGMVSTPPICQPVGTAAEPDHRDNQIVVFPNPAREVLHIQCAYSDPWNAALRDMTGRLVWEQRGISGSSVIVRTAAFPAGIYEVVVEMESGFRVSRRVILD